MLAEVDVHLLGDLLKLLLGALVVLNQPLGELLHFLVLGALLDELARLNFKLVIAGAVHDEVLFFLLIQLLPLHAMAGLLALKLALKLGLLLCLLTKLLALLLALLNLLLFLRVLLLLGVLLLLCVLLGLPIGLIDLREGEGRGCGEDHGGEHDRFSIHLRPHVWLANGRERPAVR